MSTEGRIQVSISRDKLLDLLELKQGVLLENVSVGGEGELNLLCSGSDFPQKCCPNSKIPQGLSSLISNSKVLQ